jgi:hypothetical protein
MAEKLPVIIDGMGEHAWNARSWTELAVESIEKDPTKERRQARATYL